MTCLHMEGGIWAVLCLCVFEALGFRIPVQAPSPGWCKRCASLVQALRKPHASRVQAIPFFVQALNWDALPPCVFEDFGLRNPAQVPLL